MKKRREKAASWRMKLFLSVKKLAAVYNLKNAVEDVNVLLLQSIVNKGRPGVNFTNVLCEAFTLVDPKSVKKIVFFMVLGSAPQYCTRIKPVSLNARFKQISARCKALK